MAKKRAAKPKSTGDRPKPTRKSRRPKTPDPTPMDPASAAAAGELVDARDGDIADGVVAIAIKPDAVRAVVRWMLDGEDSDTILERLAEQFPKVDAQATLQGVYEHFQQIGDFDAGTLRGWCAEAYRDLYRQLVAAGDLRFALKAIAELEKLSRGA